MHCGTGRTNRSWITARARHPRKLPYCAQYPKYKPVTPIRLSTDETPGKLLATSSAFSLCLWSETLPVKIITPPGSPVTSICHATAGVRRFFKTVSSLLATAMDANFSLRSVGSAGPSRLSTAVITVAAIRGKRLKGFIVRKEAKSHGMGQDVEGPVVPGETVVVVEDVVTTGGSALTAIQRLEKFGLQVQGVIGVIDRLEGGAEAFARQGRELRTLLSIRDFGIEAPSA